MSCLSIALDTLCLALAARGQTTTGVASVRGASATQSVTAASTTPSTTAITCPPSCPGSPPTPTIATTQIPHCDASMAAVRSGGLLLIYHSQPEDYSHQYTAGFGNLAYPRTHVPDGTPLKPLQIQSGQSASGVALSTDPPTNPDMDEHAGGYEITVCNLSTSQSHTVQSVSVQIASANSYTGQLNEWQWCDVPFDSHSRVGGAGGCGGAYFAGEYLHATFASNAAAGAAATAAQVKSGSDDGVDGYPFGPLFVTLKPGNALPINVGMTVSTTPATYTFTFQVTVDGATLTASAPPTLFAPVAHEWGGQECTTSSMESQIPQTNSSTYYICPAS